jgi:aspartate aminotransferase
MITGIAFRTWPMTASFAIAKRLEGIEPSPTLAIAALAATLQQAGRSILNLSVGEPDFDTPAFVRKAAVEAMERGATRYTPSAGTLSLREAIQAKFQADNRLDYPVASIVVTPGAKYALYALAQCLLNPGDRAVILAPYWVSYPDIIRLSGSGCLVLPTDARNRYTVDLDALDASLRPPTRLLIVNSPGNPTGIHYPRSQLEAIGSIVRRHPQVLIASDDLYEKILWQGLPFLNLPMVCPDLKDRCVVINGVSKSHAMTGWRIGYAAGPPSLIRTMVDFQSHTVSNPNSIAQAAAEAALRGSPAEVEHMVKTYHARHDFLVPRLNQMDGIQVQPADGTFYAFADCRTYLASHPEMDGDLGLARALLEQKGIAVVPGSAFGAPGHLRLSYATDEKILETAVSRLQEYFG